MRRTLAVIGASALALGLGACSAQSGEAPKDAAGAGTSAQDGSSITVWVDDTRIEELEGLKDQIKDQAGISVNLVQKAQSDMNKEFITQVPSEQGPDVIVVATDNLGEFVTNGVIAPYDISDVKESLAPSAVAGVTYEGQTYGAPYAIESIALVRNNKLSDATPASYEDMVAAGKTAGAEYPFLLQTDVNGDPYHYYPFQTSFGAPVFKVDDTGSYVPELTMGGPEGLAFAQWLAKEGSAGNLKVNVTGDIAKQAFIDGKSPFVITGPWNINAFTEAGLDISVLPIPSAGGQPAQPFVGVQAFFQSAKTRNSVAVAKFFEWVLSDDGQKALVEKGKRIPALKATAEAMTDPLTKAFGQVAATGLPMPAIPAMGSVWEFWGKTEVSIMNGQEAPDAGWNTMIKNINTKIGG